MYVRQCDCCGESYASEPLGAMWRVCSEECDREMGQVVLEDYAAQDHAREMLRLVRRAVFGQEGR